MKQEKDLIEKAIIYTLAFFFVAGAFLPYLIMLVSYSREQPTNTTMHQPEPTEQYADSLVCPD